jgi:hypothetical protein
VLPLCWRCWPQGGEAHLKKNGLNLHAAFKLSQLLDVLVKHGKVRARACAQQGRQGRAWNGWYDGIPINQCLSRGCQSLVRCMGAQAGTTAHTTAANLPHTRAIPPQVTTEVAGKVRAFIAENQTALPAAGAAKSPEPPAVPKR